FALELFLRFDPLEAFTEPQEARLPHAECSRPRRRDRSRAPADVSAPFLKEQPRARSVVRGRVEVVGSGEDELHAAWEWRRRALRGGACEVDLLLGEVGSGADEVAVQFPDGVEGVGPLV